VNAPRIPVNSLNEQYESIRAEVDAAIRRVFDRGWFILGPEVESFEREFASYCRVEHGIAVASGTEALQLALTAAGLRPGDEVITVANTAVPTVAAIRSAGGLPVFVDVHPEYYTMDPSLLEAAITPRTRAVLPVHLYGQCADMDPILAIARRHRLSVVEDACQAHGAEYRGRRAGSMGDSGCFSFYPTKNLGAYGDAGMVVTNDAATAARVRLLRNYGQAERYRHVMEGINSRMDDLQAAVLRVKLPYLGRWNARRRELANAYTGLLAKTPLGLPVEAPYGRHVFHLYVARAGCRDELRRHLEDQGIGTLIHYPVPVHQHDAYSGVARWSRLPVTERLAGEIVTLPLFPELSDSQLERVATAIQAGYQQGALAR
jgi:dTDP-4-amino-4,6-dideoxygalactose transaminase